MSVPKSRVGKAKQLQKKYERRMGGASQNRTMNVCLDVGMRPKMQEHPGINWSAVCRDAITEVLAVLEAGHE